MATLKQINDRIKAKAPLVNLYRGEGYHYYIFDNGGTMHESLSVYVPFLYMRSAADWIADGIEFATACEKIMVERSETRAGFRQITCSAL